MGVATEGVKTNASKMPGKKKGGAGKKKGKKAKAAKALERETIVAKLKALQRVYPSKCTGSILPSGRILRDCRSAIEDEKPVTQFILESSDIGRPARPPSRSKPKSADKLSSKPASVASVQPGSGTSHGKSSVTSSSPGQLVGLGSLMEASLEVQYNYLRSLHIWNVLVTDEDAVALALYMESSHGLNLKVLELRSNRLSPWSIGRLSRPIVRVGLHSLNLDYNTMPTATVLELCERLQHNIFLNTVSLNFCQIEPECGQSLGCMVASSQIRNLSLVGNRLQCHGIVDFVRPLVSLCEAEYSSGAPDDKLTDEDRPDGMSPDDPTMEREQMTKPSDLAMDEIDKDVGADLGGEMGGARMGPLTPALARLDIRDNAIDYFGISKEEKVKTFEPIISMRAVKRLILASPVLEEINLDQNLIGDGGARELLHGLQQRKEDGMPTLKLIVTAIQIAPDTFQKIIELGSPPKKKKKRGTKKKK